MIGTVSSAMHTPGVWIDGATVNHAERVISIDGLMIAPLFVDKLDELMNHYDVRGPYATEMGRELAKQYDKNVARTAVLAARQATSDLTGRAGGTRIVNVNMATSSTALTAALFQAAANFDNKYVGESDRYCFLRPTQFYLLSQDTTVINTLYGGKGSISQGNIDTIAGVTLVKTINVPGTDLSADTSVIAKYRANYANTVGIVMNKMAVGTVQLMDISLETEWEIRRQGTFMVSKMATGHDILRSDCAQELATA